MVPILETERLLLMPLAAERSAGMFSLWSNPDVCRYSGPIEDYDGNPIPSPVKNSGQSNKILNFWLRAQQDGWGFRWALLLRDSNKFVGTAGFNSLGRSSEYAYHLHPNYWGRGLMLEASIAALCWLSQQGCCCEVEVFVDPDNHASIALAKRLGLSGTDKFSDGARHYSKRIQAGSH